MDCSVHAQTKTHRAWRRGVWKCYLAWQHLIVNEKYAIFKASGMSATRAQHQYGFECIWQIERSVQVEEATIVEARRIHEAVENIAMIQGKALLASFGIGQSSSSSDETDLDDEQVPTSLCELSPNLLDLCKRTLALVWVAGSFRSGIWMWFWWRSCSLICQLLALQNARWILLVSHTWLHKVILMDQSGLHECLMAL